MCVETVLIIVGWIIIIVGWYITYRTGGQLNRENLKLQTKVETIKYMHELKLKAKEVISRITKNNIADISQTIRQIRNLLKDILEKQEYEKYTDILRQARRNIEKIEGNITKKEELEKIKSKILSDLNILDDITLMKPWIRN